MKTTNPEQITAELRLAREREYFDNCFAHAEVRSAADKFYILGQRAFRTYEHLLSTKCPEKSVLECGCGQGSFAPLMARLGARVSGIDISPVAIDHARIEGAAFGLAVDYLVMNAESMSFPDATFDMISGSGILHHLDLQKAFQEICRVMKPAGEAIFLEPLGHNPLINLYRNLTPKMRTTDEHPLLMSDLTMAHSYFEAVEIRFYSLFSLLAAPFVRVRPTRSLITVLESFDQMVFRIMPPIRRHAWLVIVQLAKPRHGC